MLKVEVGELLKEGNYNYKEGIRLKVGQEGHDIFIYFNYSTVHEVECIRKCYLEVDYYTEDEVDLMLLKFQDITLMDASYKIYLRAHLGPEYVKEGQEYLQTIYMIDAEIGAVRALRAFFNKKVFGDATYKYVYCWDDLTYDNMC